MNSNFVLSARIFHLLIASLLLTILPSCGGGGGGGGDFIGAAQVSLEASPSNIDTADRMLVRAYVSEVNENGIALKFKFPLGLSYVPSSSSLVIEEKSIDITPTVNAPDNNSRYLVYYLDNNLFTDGSSGTVEFFLEGVNLVSDGLLEVDADVDNPLIDNSTEFDITDPGFAAEDSVNVKVEG